MKKIFLLPLIPLVVALCSLQCKKDDFITLQGQITEYGTGKPIEGAGVYLLCYGGGFWGSSESEQMDVIVTDADGRFFKQFPADDVCGGAYLIVWKEGYFKRDGLGFSTGDNQIDIELDPEAWLKIRCLPEYDQDWLHFQILSYSKQVSQTKGDTTFRYFNGIPLRGNRQHRIGWKTFPNEFYQEDSIQLGAHDTTTYTIRY